MKHILAAGCLFALVFLVACGGSSPGENPKAVPGQPQETPAPVMIEPSAPPDSTAQDNTVVQEEETAPAETAAAEPAAAEAAPTEAAPEETGSDDGTQTVSNQDQQSASGSFTGVMGTEFIVPDGFVQLEESPNIGYQYTFWHPDYEIRIVVNEIAPGYLPEGAYETDRNAASEDPAVTYFNKGENWFVQSGYNNNGEEIFYAKESSTDSGLKSFRITYPTARREFGDPISADFEKNCRF